LIAVLHAADFLDVIRLDVEEKQQMIFLKRMPCSDAAIQVLARESWIFPSD
jgi:hypothetical protein